MTTAIRMTNCVTLLVALAALLALTPNVRAESDKEKKEIEETEAKQQASEDAEAAEKAAETDSKYLGKVAMRGRLVLAEAKDGENSQVLGTFNTGGHIFLVKLANDNLRQDLVKFDGKDVTLDGKVRNEAKYFIVEDVPGGAGPPPVEARSRRGL